MADKTLEERVKELEDKLEEYEDDSTTGQTPSTFKTVTPYDPRPFTIPPRPTPTPRPSPLPTPPYPPTPPQGKGNLLYVSAVNEKGIARGTNAYSGTTSWQAMNTGLTATGAKTFYGINFDPFSVKSSGGVSRFDRMWGMTGAGLYLCSNLSSTIPTWTRKLSTTNVATLLGCTVANAKIGYAFTPSLFTNQKILVIIGEDITTTIKWYVAVSTTNGATWSVNTTYYWMGGDKELNRIRIVPSSHISERYYVYSTKSDVYYDDWLGNCQGYLSPPRVEPTPLLYRTTSGAIFQRAYGPEAGNNLDYGIAPAVLPYCNSAGVPYANDSIMLMGPATWETSGTNNIRKATAMPVPLWANGYTPPTTTGIGSADMASSGGGCGIAPVYDMYNDNHIAAYWFSGVSPTSGNYLWTTIDGGGSWTNRLTPRSATRTGTTVSHLYLCPADYRIFYATCNDCTEDRTGFIGKTTDFGATWTDITRYGLSGSLVTALNITPLADDLKGSFILVDYYRV